jgi:hypothetical protein
MLKCVADHKIKLIKVNIHGRSTRMNSKTLITKLSMAKSILPAFRDAVETIMDVGLVLSSFD